MLCNAHEQYLSREMLLANGVIEVKEDPRGNRLLVEAGSDDDDEEPKQLLDVKPYSAKLDPSVSRHVDADRRADARQEQARSSPSRSPTSPFSVAPPATSLVVLVSR
jgi:hypothetical protein